MADYMAAEIYIGGKVPRSTAKEVCKVINDSGASLEWGGGRCHLNTPEDLLSARSDDTDEPRVLKLFDDQARWGEFEGLEEFLRERGIPYRRLSEGKYEYDPETVAFHPECGQLSWLTNHNQEPMVLASQLTPVAAKLTNLLETMKRGELAAVEVLTQVQDILECIKAELPPEVPPLETLEIAEN